METTEFAKLFPLEVSLGGGATSDAENLNRRRGEFMASLGDALSANGWYVDTAGFGR